MAAYMYAHCDTCEKTEAIYANDLDSDSFDLNGAWVTLMCSDCLAQTARAAR